MYDRTTIVLMQKYPLYKPEEVKIAEKILTVLAIGLAIPAVLTSPYGLYNIVRGAAKYYFRKNDFHREVRRLQKRGYISLTKTPQGWLVQLLKKGKKRLNEIEFKNLKLKTQPEWDKKWRFFVFDIPEKHQISRHLLTSKLKELGMYNIQRSVFAYPYDCSKELEFISKHYKIDEFTTYIEAEHTDIDRELKKFFRIK